MTAALGALLFACGDAPDEAIAGRWVVDVEAWLADPALGALPPAPAASVEGQVRAMGAQTVFVFEPGRCRRLIAGRASDHACRFERDDRGTVVLRAEAPDGARHFVRIRPREGGVDLVWRGDRLPLRRARAGGAGGSP